MSRHHQQSIITDGLVFYLNAHDPKSYVGSGTLTYDRIEHKIGTLYSGVGYSETGFQFNSSSLQYIGSPNPSSLNFGTGDFTIEFMTYKTGYGNFQGGSTCSKGLGTSVGWGPRDYAWYLYTSAGALARVPWNETVNVWQHHALVHNVFTSPFIKYYRNGSLFYTSAANGLEYVGTSGYTTSNTVDFYLGKIIAGGVTRCFDGFIPYLRAYNKQLSIEEINHNYDFARTRLGI